ncbi:hypothetical protein ACWFQ8_27785 [Streptomyces sp. NPDC055254]
MTAANPLLHRVIQETGLTYEALAHRLNASARAAGLSTAYDRTSIAHWLRGSTPRDPLPGLLCEILSRHLRRPVGPADIGMGHAPPSGPPTSAADLLAGVPGLRPQPHRRRRADHGGLRVPEQRETPDGRGGSGAPPALGEPRPPGEPVRSGASHPPGAPHSPRASGQGSPAGARIAALSHSGLRRTAEVFFAGQADALGGDATAPVLLAYLQSTFRPVLTASVGSLTPPELSHAARTVLLLARSYADQCAFAASRRTLGRAASLAELAGESATRAIALRMLSQDALDHHQSAVALSYVRQAREAASGAPAAVRAYVAAQAAHVHAALGHRDSALAWLDTAGRLRGRLPVDPDPFHTYRPTALDFKRAVVLGLLGDYEAAHAALDASLETRPEEQERAITLTHVERARLYRLDGREADAAAELRRAQHLNRGVRSPRAGREIERLGPAAHPR